MATGDVSPRRFQAGYGWGEREMCLAAGGAETVRRGPEPAGRCVERQTGICASFAPARRGLGIRV